MLKRTIDVLSLVSVAVFVGVVIWLAIYGDGPRGSERWSVETKILLWDAAPVVFGGNWLLVRYANFVREKFPRWFGPRGYLFYVILALAGVIFAQRLVIFANVIFK